MNKNLLLIIAAIVLAVGAVFVISYSPKPKIDVGGIILFYGDGCPHCKIVDDFINQNKIEDKIKFTRLEVFNNKNNAKILSDKAVVCGLDTSQIGVPFLWDGQSCFMGDVDVIKFFEDKSK